MSNFPKNGLSFSALTDYLTCPQFYKLKHIDKIIPNDASLDTECGTALHLGVNDILSKEGDGIEVALMYWDSLDHAGLKKFSYDADQLRRCLEVWLAKFTKFHAKHFRPVMMEERLFGHVGDHQFQGTPDFVGYYKDVPSIVDFKTASMRYDKRKILADDQTSGYAKLVKDKLGFEAKQAVYLVFVKHRDEPSIQNATIKKLTDYCNSSTMSNMKAQMDDIQSRSEFFKNTRNCVRGPIVCPAFSRCHGEGVDNE